MNYIVTAIDQTPIVPYRMDHKEKIAVPRTVCTKQQSKIKPPRLKRYTLVAQAQNLRNEYERIGIHSETHVRKPTQNWQKKFIKSIDRTNHTKSDGKS